MTACVNRKHTKKVAAVVTASLVGALSLGVAPVVAMADDGIALQFVQPDGAFKDAQLVSVTWTRPLADADGDGVYSVQYAKNQPVALSELKLTNYYAGMTADLTINAQDDDYSIKYFARDSKGNPTGDEITSDITEVGKYVAVVTAVDGPYKGGEYYVRFDINAIQLNNIVVKDSTVTYNAEAHTFEFALDTDGVPGYSNGDTKLYPGDDYDVEYIATGHDATVSTEVKSAGTYTAKITGKGGYAGTVELSSLITVNKLDLSQNDLGNRLPSPVRIVGLTSSASEVEPKNLFAIIIDGQVYSGDDAIMSELKAELTDGTDSWFDNGMYDYTVTAAKAGDPNIAGSTTFDAHKVSYDMNVTYDGAALADSYDVFVNGDQKWDSYKLAAHADDGSENGIDTEFPNMSVSFINENGEYVNEGTVNSVPGTYTAVIEYVPGTHKAGCVDFTTIHTYTDAVNADASAAVLFDADGAGSGRPVVVSSINTVYDGTDWTNFINVVVKDSKGNDVSFDCDVKYYNAEGKEVGKIVDAGTYTLKVTSDTYKLTGTTEMTITVAPVSGPTVTVERFKDHPFFEDDDYTYLPWFKDGWTINALDLVIKDADGNVIPNAMQVYKVTILDANGNEVKKVTDEGVYTLHFEARNADAANNYGVPADVTFECVKDGNNADGIDHLIFADVKWSDYFADAVSKVNDCDLMHGYAGTLNFGAQDDIKRGDVAIVLMNMASMFGADVDETDAWYVEGVGYKTGFSDVDSESYYAKAILWAKQAGVINGDTGSNTFRPEEKVTRQEFAAMMANFASKYDKGYEAADADALDAVSDGAQVADWAKESVAWAVENGIMGNAGSVWPGQNIKRCDAAGMVFLYALDK